MLTELQLQGFKCFEDLSLQLRPLTVLSGANGGGKSTIIQALVLLAQSLTRQEWGNTLLLEGPDLALGSAIDVLHQRSKRRGLGLSVATADQRIRWRFDARDRRAPSLELREAFIDEAPQVLREPLRWLLPHDLGARSPVITALRRVSWITAERIGPRELLPLAGPPSSAQVGARGELAAALLYWRDSDEVRPRLRIPDVAPTLLHQVRARMQQVFPGCDLRVSAVDGASAISLRLKSNAWSDFQRPQNVGFGLTQLFPILVAVLSAGEGECLLIENPSARCSPRPPRAACR